jgi:hypothetical protein
VFEGKRHARAGQEAGQYAKIKLFASDPCEPMEVVLRDLRSYEAGE